MPNIPAFPRSGTFSEGYFSEGQTGMSLLDYFAGQALAGLLANQNYSEFPDEAAAAAYRVAKAMCLRSGQVQP